MFISRVILQVPVLKKTEKNVANIDYSQHSSKSGEFKLIHREYELLRVTRPTKINPKSGTDQATKGNTKYYLA